MVKSKVYEIIDEARKLGAFEIRLSGGEITIRDDLPDIIQYARKKHLNVVLLTNMSRLSSELLNCIKEYGVKRIEVTLFSLCEEVHDSFVGVNGALNKTFSNIYKLKSLGTDILVKTWAIKSNISELEEMSDFFNCEGIDFNIHTQIYADIHGNFKLPIELQLSREEFNKALQLSDKSLKRKNCNMNCIHCFINEHKNRGLSAQKIFNLIDELRELGVCEVQLTGGEIFVRDDIMEIISYARKLYFKVILLTNVTLLNNNIIDELEELNVETVSTTLFSLNNEINDRRY